MFTSAPGQELSALLGWLSTHSGDRLARFRDHLALSGDRLAHSAAGDRLALQGSLSALWISLSALLGSLSALRRWGDYRKAHVYPKAPIPKSPTILPKSPYTQKPVYPKAVHKSSFWVNNPFLTPFWGP
jgi:hypothetical protein